MKKNLLILLLLSVVIFTGFFLKNTKIILKQDNPGISGGLLQPTVLHLSKNEPGTPKSIDIPKIGVSANIENVGLDSEGKMDVPKNVYNVGWYELGFRPGEKGSAVVAGHLDGVNGEPVIFFNLNSLNQGDFVTITDDKNNKYRFVVYDKRVYPYDQLPLTDIFASNENTSLNLITCDGVFDRQSRNYSQRLVVYSRLTED